MGQVETPSVKAPLLEGFPPLSGPGARVLVLGTMPGGRSLEAGEYYAHPRNAFWGIMAALVGFAPTLDYPERVRRLTGAGIAVWDVLKTCTREGSLDTAIDEASAVPNDFARFFDEQPALSAIVFNGGHAERLFRRRVLPLLGPGCPPTCRRLPSTSPTNARLTFAAKLEAWRVLATI